MHPCQAAPSHRNYEPAQTSAEHFPGGLGDGVGSEAGPAPTLGGPLLSGSKDSAGVCVTFSGHRVTPVRSPSPCIVHGKRPIRLDREKGSRGPGLSRATSACSRRSPRWPANGADNSTRGYELELPMAIAIDDRTAE